MINETCVNITRGSSNANGEPPRKTQMYMRRVQRPPSDELRVEKPISDTASWGFRFEYGQGELTFYSKDEDEDYRMVPSEIAIVNSNDWGVLIDVIPDMIEKCMKSTEAWEDLSFVWLSRTSNGGRWFFRVKIVLQSGLEKETGENVDREDLEFQLESFNSECGVFVRILTLSLPDWCDTIGQYASRISALFHSSRLWYNIIGVKKSLTYV